MNLTEFYAMNIIEQFIFIIKSVWFLPVGMFASLLLAYLMERKDKSNSIK